MSDLTHRSTSEELARLDEVSREQVLRRLRDWRDRVHNLYDEIERTIQGTHFRVDRQGKHTSHEELPQRVGLADDNQPKIDVLRIVRPDDTNAAILSPRGLWIIGANGRIDLRIVPPVGGSEAHILVDQSEPFTRPPKWIRMPIGSPFDREPFDPHWLLARLR
jgi:hypothetical protein